MITRNRTVHSTEEYAELKREVSSQGGSIEHTFALKEGAGISVQYSLPAVENE